MGRFALLLMAGLFACVLQASAQSSGQSGAGQPPLPRFDGATRLGVASCAGPCHARQSALGVVEGASVRGSEIVAWQDPLSDRGAHARAFESLRSERGRDIGRKLGMADPAREPECLSCHADAAPNRGPEFQISDGVSCEACHGGAGPWLASHYAPGATHEKNIAEGMYPTADLGARAKLCASCHLGAAARDQFVTHRIMGAGHPRLAFEIELFTALQAHHFEDDAYFADKPRLPRAQVWALGQAAAAAETLERFLQRGAGAGVFPELVFYDCHSCHRPISDSEAYRSSWRPNPGRPIGPGVPPFNDANFIMLAAASEAFAPALTAPFEARVAAFHAALDGDAGKAQAEARALLGQTRRLFAAFSEPAAFSTERTRKAMRAVLGEALGPRYTAYAAAEQAVMAVDSFKRGLADAGALPEGAVRAADPVIAAAYDAVEDPNAYDQALFRARLAAVAERLGAR